MLRPLVAVVLLAGAPACGGDGLTSANRDAAPDTAGALDAAPVVLPRPVVQVPYVDVAKTPSDCAPLVGGQYQPASVSEAASLLVGRWRQCLGNPLVPGTKLGAIEFARDRRWRALMWSDDGQLVPADGRIVEGVWWLSAEETGDLLDTRFEVRIHADDTLGTERFLIGFLRDPLTLFLGTTTAFVWLGE